MTKKKIETKLEVGSVYRRGILDEIVLIVSRKNDGRLWEFYDQHGSTYQENGKNYHDSDITRKETDIGVILLVERCYGNMIEKI